MRRLKSLAILFVGILLAYSLKAGNEQRAGEAGASQLLINPWGASTGWANSNMSAVKGLEAMYLNVAGLAFTKKLDLGFTYTNYLKGSNININNFGFATKSGEAGVLAAGITMFNFGDIPITSVENPDGTGNTFKPTYTTITASYARVFSNAIYGGASLKVITERIDNLNATGVAIDAGIQYVAGARDNFRFGVSMQNVGPTMKYSGNGLAYRAFTPNDIYMTFDFQSNEFELPSLLRIGVSNEFMLAEDHFLTLAGSFTSNSFTSDQYSIGAEYNFMNYFLARGGYTMEKGIFSDSERKTAFTGLSAGATLKIPIDKENGTFLNVDYSYRNTNPFHGIHTIGVRLTL